MLIFYNFSKHLCSSLFLDHFYKWHLLRTASYSRRNVQPRQHWSYRGRNFHGLPPVCGSRRGKQNLLLQFCRSASAFLVTQLNDCSVKKTLFQYFQCWLDFLIFPQGISLYGVNKQKIRGWEVFRCESLDPMKRVVRTCQVVRNSSVLDLRSHSCSENDNLLLLVGVNQIACVALDDNFAEDNEWDEELIS